MTPALPRSLDEITPEWLTLALRESGAADRAAVVGVRREKIGDFSNQLSRLHPVYDAPEPGAPTSLVVKRPRERTFGQLREGEGFANEIRFYTEVARDLPVETPRAIFGAVEGEHAILVLEEVDGLLPVNFLRGIEPEHEALAIPALARLHAHAWGDASLPASLPRLSDAGFRARIGEGYDRGWAASRAYFVDAGHAAFVEIGDALVGRAADTIAPLGAPATLLHGDAHFENLPLRGDDVVFLDWEAVRRGHASFDVAVFCVQSYRSADRCRQERRIVEEHAAGVARARPDVDWSDPWLDYRRGVLYWMIHMLQDASLAPGAPPWIVIDRYVAAAVELACGDLIASA